MKTGIGRRRGKPDPGILADTIESVVAAADPERIVLFGSAARGTMGRDSDLDLLVIKAGNFDRHRVTTAIYRGMSGKIAVDVVVVTPEEAERYRNSHYLVIGPAMCEGKVIYEAQTAAAGRSTRVDSSCQKQSGVGPKRHPKR